jgi:hypothetical protein
MQVYVLHHVHTTNNFGDVKLLGVYLSYEDASAASKRFALLPGFSENPDDFHIGEYNLNQDYWTEGFVTCNSPQTELTKT